MFEICLKLLQLSFYFIGWCIRKKLLGIMSFMGILTKLIRLVKMNVLGSEARMYEEGAVYRRPLRRLVA